MTISLAAVFFPLVFMSGSWGRIFREFAITIVVAIIASVCVADAHSADVRQAAGRPGDTGSSKNWIERGVGRIEKRVLGVLWRVALVVLRHRWISAVTWVICLAGTVLLFVVVPKAFHPSATVSFIWGS